MCKHCEVSPGTPAKPHLANSPYLGLPRRGYYEALGQSLDKAYSDNDTVRAAKLEALMGSELEALVSWAFSKTTKHISSLG